MTIIQIFILETIEKLEKDNCHKIFFLLGIVYLAIVFYNGARAVRSLRFGLLHWQSRQRQHYWEIVHRLQ